VNFQEVVHSIWVVKTGVAKHQRFAGVRPNEQSQ
jgi:hypothetical protein